MLPNKFTEYLSTIEMIDYRLILFLYTRISFNP